MMNRKNSRQRKVGGGNRFISTIATVLVHALIIGALFFSFTHKKQEVITADYAEKVDVVKATTVDASQIEKKQERLKEEELEKKRQKALEKRRLKELQQQAEREEQKIEDLKKQQVEAIADEKKRKEIALKKEQIETKKREEARKRKEEKDRKKKKAETKRKEKADKLKQERERMAAEESALQEQLLQEQLAQEAAFQAEKKAAVKTTTLLSKYGALIKNRVTQFTNLSPATPYNLTVIVKVRLSSSGDVTSAVIVESSGNSLFDKSMQTAILSATPLPIPTVDESEEAHRTLREAEFEFNSNDLL